MREFIIKQLTQSSTWFGLIIISCALLLPRDYMLIVGALILITDDDHSRRFFERIRKVIDGWTK